MALTYKEYFCYEHGISEDSLSPAVIRVALREWEMYTLYFNSLVTSTTNALRYACTRLDTLTEVHRKLLETLKGSAGDMSSAQVLSAELMWSIISDCEELREYSPSIDEVFERLGRNREKLSYILEKITAINELWYSVTGDFPRTQYPILGTIADSVLEACCLVVSASADMDKFLGAENACKTLSETNYIS